MALAAVTLAFEAPQASVDACTLFDEDVIGNFWGELAAFDDIDVAEVSSASSFGAKR